MQSYVCNNSLIISYDNLVMTQNENCTFIDKFHYVKSCLKTLLKIELHRAQTHASARRLLFGSVLPLGNWFRASLNFYSLPGTDDKKIAQTENQSVFLILLHLLPCFHLLFRFPCLLSLSLPLLLSVLPPVLSYSSRSFFLHFSSPFPIFRFPFTSVRVMLTSPVFYLLIDGSRVNPPESGQVCRLEPLEKIPPIRSR